MSKWISSINAGRVFFYSSWIVIFVGIFLLFMLTPWFDHMGALPRGDMELRILGGLLGILGAPAGIIIWFGMAFFCIYNDRSSLGAKILWFIIFLSTASFGSVAYFFKVYKKQVSPITSSS